MTMAKNDKWVLEPLEDNGRWFPTNIQCVIIIIVIILSVIAMIIKSI